MAINAGRQTCANHCRGFHNTLAGTSSDQAKTVTASAIGRLFSRAHAAEHGEHTGRDQQPR